MEEDDCRMVCFYCGGEDDDDCGCRQAMSEYGQVQCEFCDCMFTGQFVEGGTWAKPCDKCVGAYVKDYKAQKEKEVKAKAPEVKAPEAKAPEAPAKAEALHVPGFTVHAAIDMRNRPALSYEAAYAEADDVLAALARM